MTPEVGQWYGYKNYKTLTNSIYRNGFSVRNIEIFSLLLSSQRSSEYLHHLEFVSSTVTALGWVVIQNNPAKVGPRTGIESSELNYFQFIDKKFQSGQHYVHKITKLHRDSFSKVRITNPRLEILNLLTILINCNKSIVWAGLSWTAGQTRTFRQSSHDTPEPGLTEPPVPLSYNENKPISLENP